MQPKYNSCPISYLQKEKNIWQQHPSADCSASADQPESRFHSYSHCNCRVWREDTLQEDRRPDFILQADAYQ
jgi:hypothetical protein